MLVLITLFFQLFFLLKGKMPKITNRFIAHFILKSQKNYFSFMGQSVVTTIQKTGILLKRAIYQ